MTVLVYLLERLLGEFKGRDENLTMAREVRMRSERVLGFSVLG